MRKREQPSSYSLTSSITLPIYESRRHKSFPKLVNMMSNPFTKSGLNFGINLNKSMHEELNPIKVNKHLKSRSMYYRTCKGCSVNINRLVITGSIERISEDKIVPKALGENA